MIWFRVRTVVLGGIFACLAACRPSAACNPAPAADLVSSPIVEQLRRGMESGESTFDHGTYDELLADHVNEETGRVDYGGLSKDEARLDAYLERVAGADLSALSRDAQLALLINAYNAYTLTLILEHYPGIESIRDISNPWTTERYEVGGYTLSLDQIEHGLIRPLYQDPRIHFAVNCAAVDCPYLAEDAYTGPSIDEQLEARAEAILTNEQFVRLEEGTLRYPKVMDWYRSDFVDPEFRGHAPNVAQYIARYATEEVQAFIREHDGDPAASPLDYDWSLNDVRASD